MSEGPGAQLRLRAHRRRSFFRLRRRNRVRYYGLPIATFLQATPHRADLRLLLHNKRRAALRARLGERHMRRGEIAIRVSRAAVENSRTSAPALARAPAPHKFAFIALRALDPHRDRPRVFALGISSAADELSEAPVFLHQSVAAQRALFIQPLVRLQRNARALHHASRRLAIRIAGASQKCAKSPALD